jgi:NitT/TauT family transport system substrate-binding protein
MTKQPSLTRRHYLAASGAGVLALGLASTRGVAAPETIRQGYQTNIWGMPTYYLMKSGYLEKHNLAAEEFAVPSGNLTMQQMVARQVDLGTYAGQSFIIGSAKGGLIAIALIEHVGKTARVTTRKDLNITKVEELRGLKIANQTGSSVGNVFVDTIMPQHGLKKGDYQEVRMERHRLRPDRFFQRRSDAGVHGGNARVRAAEARHPHRLSQGLARRGAGFQEQSEKSCRRDLRVLCRQGL